MLGLHTHRGRLHSINGTSLPVTSYVRIKPAENATDKEHFAAYTVDARKQSLFNIRSGPKSVPLGARTLGSATTQRIVFVASGFAWDMPH